MAEKINILELDIDIDAISKSTADFKSRLDSATESLNRMKKAGDTSSESFVRQQAEVNKLKGEYRESQRELTKLTSVSNTQNLSIKEARNLLSVVSSQWAKQADLYGENSKEAERLAKLKLELTDRLKEEEAATGDTSRSVGDYSKGVVDALSKTSLFGKEITTIKQVSSAFSPILKAVGQDALEAGRQMIFASKGTEGLSRSQKIAAITSNVLSGALKLLKVALISTGIGAIVVVLGSLVAYFSSTQKGIDAVNKALVPLKVVFETLFGVLQEVGEAIASLFTAEGIKSFGKAIKDFVLSRIELMQKGFGAIFKIITGDISEGMKDLKDIATQVKDEVVGVVDSLKGAAGELSERMREAYERGKLIAELQIQIEEAERDIIVSRAEQELQLKRQEIIAKDISKNVKERQAAIDEQLRLSKSIVEEENKILDLQIQQLRLKQESNDTSREEEKELQELIAQRLKNEQRTIDIERRNLGAQNQLRKEIQSRAAKAQAAAIKAAKDELKLYIEQNTVRAQTLQEQVELAEKVRDRRLEILDQEIKAGKKTRQEAALEEFLIKQDFLNLQTQLVIDNADRELAAFIEANQSKLDANKFFTDELLQQEENRLNAILEKERRFAELRLEQGIISQTEYNDAINELNAANEAAIENLRKERQEAEEQRRLIDLENKRAIDEENFLNEFERRSEQLEQQRLQEVEAAEKTGADIALINQKFAQLQSRLDNEANIARLDGQQQLVRQLGGLAKTFFAESKALSSALTLADTFLAAQKAYLSQFLPIPDPSSPARGTLAAGIAVAQGLGNVARINGIKFEKGGFLEIGGKRHSQGGTKFIGEDGTSFEAERGELIGVLNRRAAASFMKYNNSFLNGARSPRGNFLEAGGIVQRAVSQNIDSGVTIVQQQINPDEVALKLAEAYSELPPGQIAVEDINQGQDDFSEVTSGANI